MPRILPPSASLARGPLACRDRALRGLVACVVIGLLALPAVLAHAARVTPDRTPAGDPSAGTIFPQRVVIRRPALVFNDYNLFIDPNPFVVTKEFSFVYTNDADRSLAPGKQRALFHLFYQRSGGSQRDETTIAHAWSRDLRNWLIDTLGVSVDTTWWNASHVWSPSVVQHDGRWYLFYTGVDTKGDQRIGYMSTGLLDTTDTNWDGPRTLAWQASDTRWAVPDPWTYSGITQFRDPHVVEDPQDRRRLLMFYAAHDSLTLSLGTGGLAVGVARSEPNDPRHWQDLGYITNTHEQFTRIGQLESPNVFSWPGYPSRWCLAYSSAGTPAGETGNTTIRFQTLNAGAALTDTARASWSEPVVLKQYLHDDPTVFGWSGTEQLRVGDIDYLAGFTAWGPGFQGIAIARMHWQGGDFTLGGFANVGVDEPTVARSPVALSAAARGASRVRFTWRMANAGRARLEILDVAGRRVATPLEASLAAGEGSLVWRAASADGAPLASGAYFARLTTTDGTAAARFAVTR